jgi:hypothetical protein
LGLVADRRTDYKNFGKIQKDTKLEIQKWSNILNDLKNNEAIIKKVIVSANNYYDGFGPMATRMLR